jgi:uncharacterized membrane protein
VPYSSSEQPFYTGIKIHYLSIPIRTSMNPTEDLSNYKFGIFYFNRNDPRTLVPKRVAMNGIQPNFARPVNTIIVIVLLALAVILITLSKA